jgi:tetratricopeptide (TPR) repeat protein
MSACSPNRLPGRYALHDLLRDYAADRARAAETSAEGAAALRRILDHYLHTAAAAAARALDPVPDLPDLGPPQHGVTPECITDRHQAQAWFGAERKALLAVIGLATGHGFVDHARQLPWTLVTFQDRGGHWDELAASHRAALACAERLGDVAGQARTHRNLGRAQLQLGQTGQARAHLTHAASLSRSLGDRAAEARALLGLSVVFERGLQIQASLASSLQALELARAAGDPALQAKACNNVGYDHAILGDTRQGLTYCRLALDLYRQDGNPAQEANTWDSLATSTTSCVTTARPLPATSRPSACSARPARNTRPPSPSAISATCTMTQATIRQRGMHGSRRWTSSTPWPTPKPCPSGTNCKARRWRRSPDTTAPAESTHRQP